MAEPGFYIGDKLPLIYDVAVAIHSLCPSGSKSGRLKVINSYGIAVHTMWVKSFGSTHVLALKNVKQKIEAIMKDYDSKCYKASSKGRRDDEAVKPLRILNKIWRFEVVPVKKNTPMKKRKMQTNNDLFDIGKEMDKLEGDEKAYYLDQCSSRIFRLSEQIDNEYEEEVQMNVMHEEEAMSFCEEEESFSNPPEFQEIISCGKSRKVEGKKVFMIDKDVQTELEVPNYCPEIRKGRNTLPKVKDTIATVSYRTGISVPKARVATQTVCEKMYGHCYTLEKEQKRLETVNEEDVAEPLSKMPRTMEDYKPYRYVLPSVKSINTYKHLKAMSQEIDAAEALMKKDGRTKVTLHYDTTSRSRIPGEWPGLILNFLNKDPAHCKMYTLRALTFAFEDRNQIAKLILETLSRLSAATGGRATARDLWEQITAFMTDAVSKNLKVEALVAEKLESNHIPYHLLCKAHTCEKLDECNENVLMKVEEMLKIREIIEKREPRLKSFIRKSKSVTKAAISALLQLVAKGGDGKSVSLADDFDQVLEEDGVYKSYSLYKEKRFTKLGYTAGAIYDCLPQFRKVLQRTNTNNLLVRACGLYLESEFIVAALKALSNFTYRVTMPYLNAVQQVDQNELIKILPKLCTDLKNGSAGHSLDNYHVDWTHINMQEQKLTTQLDNYLQKQMCIDAGKGVELQCAQEYWCESDDPRATELFKLTEEERENIPTENLEPERYMAKVGSLAAQSAAHSNKNFKAKRMRDDLVFVKESNRESSEFTASQRKIFQELDVMETKWTEGQQNEYKKKFADMMTRKEKRSDFINLLLKKCKIHNGPITNEVELSGLIKFYEKNKKLLKSALRTEIQYQKYIHAKDAQERPDLYKVNNLDEDQLKLNLMALLLQDENDDGEHMLFRTEDEIMEILNPDCQSTEDEIEEQEPYKLQDAIAVVWEAKNGVLAWYIGFYLGKNIDGTLRVTHLVRNSKKYDFWKREVTDMDDIQDVHQEQIVSVKVVGDWFFGRRVPLFAVDNWKDIQNQFEEDFI